MSALTLLFLNHSLGISFQVQPQQSLNQIASMGGRVQLGMSYFLSLPNESSETWRLPVDFGVVACGVVAQAVREGFDEDGDVLEDRHASANFTHHLITFKFIILIC